MLKSLPGASALVAPSCRQSILSRQQCIAQPRDYRAVATRRAIVGLGFRFASVSAIDCSPNRSAGFVRSSTEAGRLGHEDRSQSAATPADDRQQGERTTITAKGFVLKLQSRQPQQQRQRRQPPGPPAPPPWRLPSAAHVRAAVYLALGTLLAWRYVAVQLTAGSGGFAALSLGASFHSASQTGQVALSQCMFSAFQGEVKRRMSRMTGTFAANRRCRRHSQRSRRLHRRAAAHARRCRPSSGEQKILYSSGVWLRQAALPPFPSGCNLLVDAS